MYKINDNYQKLPGSYLFSTIAKKVNAYSEANPDKKIIRLGIGDVTQPIAPAIIEAMHKAVDEMGHAETFHGYAPDLGYEFLRSAIVKNDYQARGCDITVDEIFVSDGRAIPVIFRRFLHRITALQCVIRSTRYMWIPMLWRDVPVLMIRRRRCGAM